MSYRNSESIEATIESYLRALKEMQKYCRYVEPSCNESNNRTVLPTQWHPIDLFDKEVFKREANIISVDYSSLFDFDRPKLITKGQWDYDRFFKLSWGIRFPFNIYEWELPRSGYINDDGKVIPFQPAKMVTWCSPQYLILGEMSSSWPTIVWSLSTFMDNYLDIECFMDDNEFLRDKFRKAVVEATNEIQKWQDAWRIVTKQLDI